MAKVKKTSSKPPARPGLDFQSLTTSRLADLLRSESAARLAPRALLVAAADRLKAYDRLVWAGAATSAGVDADAEYDFATGVRGKYTPERPKVGKVALTIHEYPSTSPEARKAAMRGKAPR